MSRLESSIAVQIRALKLPEPEREYLFARPRRFRFDFAWPSYGVALETEGATWANGRHNRGTGYESDCLKYSIVVLTVSVAAMAVCVVGIVRNRKVYKYRLWILDTIAEQIERNPYDVDWRIKIYKSVSYNQMAFKFWKPLDSFYPDKSFLDLNDVRGHAPWEKANILEERIAAFPQTEKTP